MSFSALFNFWYFLSYSRQEDISCLNKSLIFLNIIHEIFMSNHTIYIIVINYFYNLNTILWVYFLSCILFVILNYCLFFFSWFFSFLFLCHILIHSLSEAKTYLESVFILTFSSVQSVSRVLLFATPWIAGTPGLPVHHQLPEFTQTYVHRVGDAIQPFLSRNLFAQVF